MYAGGANYGGNGPITSATEKNGVVALTASESRVYWLEYGTRDALGNYLHDGALMSYSVVDGTTAILAAGLPGPVGLALTTSHAYVFVDGAPLIGTPTQPQLLRVPLAGGGPVLVQEGAQPYSFAAAGSRAFWSSWGNAVYSMLSDPNAVPTVFISEKAYNLTTDATDLYYGWSVGSFVQQKYSGNKLVSLVVKPVTEDSPDATAPSFGFDAKEFASDALDAE